MRNAMRKIIKNSQKFFAERSGTTDAKKFAAGFDYFPSPEGLRPKRHAAALKPLKIEPLFSVGFALHSTVCATQRFHAMNGLRA
jgi:hypothetical protein